MSTLIKLHIVKKRCIFHHGNLVLKLNGISNFLFLLEHIFVCLIFSVLIIKFCILISVQIYANDNEIDLNKIDLDKIKEKLPFEVPPSLQNVTLPSIDEVKKVIKEKCSKVSKNDDAYAAIERGAEDLKNCTTGLIDYEVLQKEIEEAEPSGELDTVFNK